MDDIFIILNGEQLTLQEFEQKKAEILKQKSVQLVEKAPNVFVTRLLG